QAGVRRVVFLSTVAVYGDATGELSEQAVTAPTGSPDGDSKIAAGEGCRAAGTPGLEVVVLRPTIVYGPFSGSWTVEPAQRMIAGTWLLPPDACEGICNLLYVDDLVEATALALKVEGAAGEAFNINGPERVTWNQYFHTLNRAMGLPPL